jgi:hypothetical protein
VVELEAHRHDADARAARRLDVVDAADRGHGALDRRREEAAHGLGARADVDRRDDDGRALELRVLLHGSADTARQPISTMHEVDDDREDRVLDEDVGDGLHGGSSLSAQRRSRCEAPAPRRRDVHEDTLEELERARGRDALTGRPGARARPRRPAPGRRPRAQRRAQLALGVGRQHEHVVAHRALAQRRHRHDDGLDRRPTGTRTRTDARPGTARDAGEARAQLGRCGCAMSIARVERDERRGDAARRRRS